MHSRQVRQHALDLHEVGAHGLNLGVDPHVDARLRRLRRREPRRSPPRPSTRRAGAQPCAPRALRGRADRRSGAPARAPSSTTRPPSSSRSASVRFGARTAAPAATIAVTGERRSCDTARNTAVFTASLRRRPSVWTASPISRSRSSTMPSIAERVGTIGSRSRSRNASGSSPGRQRPEPPPSATRVSPGGEHRRTARRARSSPTATRTRAQAGDRPTRAHPRHRCEPAAVAPCAAVRSASARRRSASIARARGALAHGARDDRGDEEGGDAIQLRLSATVKRPTGGMWKKLNAAALRTAVAMPSQAPQNADTITTASR